MFLLLMLVSLVVAVATTTLVILFFRGSISGILGRIVADPVAAAWRRYVSFALLVVGISSGVSLWTLERYVQAPGNVPVQTSPPTLAAFPAPVTTEAWVFEVYRTVLGSLRGLSGALLLFFGIALVVSGIQRGLGERGGAGDELGGRRGQDRSRGRGLQSVPNGRSGEIRSGEIRSGENRSGEPRRPLGPTGGSSGRRGDLRSRDGESRPREGDLRRDLRAPRPPEGRGGEDRGRDDRSREGRGRDDRSREERPGEPGASSAPRAPGESRGLDGRPQNGDLVRSGTLERRPLPNRP